jgi:hypothetical protein
MGVIWWVRSTVFSFCGGYTMTSFYNDAVRLSQVDPAHRKHPQSHNSPAKRRFLSWGTNPPPTTFTQDVRETIMENEVACALLLAAIVLAGGMSATAGGFMSFVLEGPDGPERYKQIRDTYRAALNNEL